jgi:hypothetical protein
MRHLTLLTTGQLMYSSHPELIVDYGLVALRFPGLTLSRILLRPGTGALRQER